MKETNAQDMVQSDPMEAGKIYLFGKEIGVSKKKVSKAKYKAIWTQEKEAALDIPLPEDNEDIPIEEDLPVEDIPDDEAEAKDEVFVAEVQPTVESAGPETEPAQEIEAEKVLAEIQTEPDAQENLKQIGQGKGKLLRKWKAIRKEQTPTISDVRDRQMMAFFDRIAPGVIKFYTDYYILGNTYRCAWALREYAPVTEDLAILRGISDKGGVTMRIYHTVVTAQEQRQIFDRAVRKSGAEAKSGDWERVIEGAADQEDLISIRKDQRKSKDNLVRCTVYLELKAQSLDALRNLQAEVDIELLHGKISVDKLMLRQREGCISVMPFGFNALGQQYERVLPMSSVANFYPFTYAGRTDPKGQYIGKAIYGTNLLVDFDLRDSDHTNGSALVLGNSGEGKSYLMKLLLTLFRETGKAIMILDPESEYRDLCYNMGGCDLDLMSGEYRISPLEPRRWTEEDQQSDGKTEDDKDEPVAFKKSGTMAQHISWLKDFFAAYQREFTSEHLNTLEILLLRLYEKFGITLETDVVSFPTEKFPIMEDLFHLCEDTLMHYDEGAPELFTKDCLRKVTLGIRSICVGAESAYFNGHTNITDSHFLVFDVADMLDTNDALKNAMLFNILSYMSDALLKKGNAALGLDEAYLFLDYPIAVKYLRSFMKRVRKRESSILIASTHVEDFLVPGIKEYTKPLFSTPSHRFLFHPGGIGEREFCDILRVEPNEYELISNPNRGHCLYCSGRERYYMEVEVQPYRVAMFGTAGGR